MWLEAHHHKCLHLERSHSQDEIFVCCHHSSKFLLFSLSSVEACRSGRRSSSPAWGEPWPTGERVCTRVHCVLQYYMWWFQNHGQFFVQKQRKTQSSNALMPLCSVRNIQTHLKWHAYSCCYCHGCFMGCNIKLYCSFGGRF